MRGLLGLYALFVLSIKVSAQSQHCSDEGVCIALSIPDGSGTNSKNADILATIRAPQTAGWFGIGWGQNGMVGSFMLVSWPYNKTVTITTRVATGYFQPPLYSGPTLEIISSSANETYSTAGLRCVNCTTWSSGSLDIESANAGFIYAYATTPPENPADPNSVFYQHDSMGTYTIDMKAAHVASTVTTPPPITINKGSNSGSSSGLTSRQTVYIVHGVMMGLAWLIFFPLGAIVIRFLGSSFDKPANVHRLIQLGTLFLVLGAVGVGVYLATGHHFTQFHHYFGICIAVALLVQAYLGWYHHKRFVRDKPSHRRWFTHLHLWLGRTTILCGLANCGFGLLLAKVDRKWVIIWWIICAALAVVYFAGYIILRCCQRIRRKRTAGESFGSAINPGYSAQRYARAETYENNPLQPAPRYTTSGNENVGHERYQLRETSYEETPYDPPPVRYENTGREDSPGRSRQDLHL